MLMNYENYAKRIFRLAASQGSAVYYGEFEDYRKKKPQFVLKSFIYYVGCIYRELQESFGDLAEDVLKLFDEPYMSEVIYSISSGYNISETIDQIIALGNDTDTSNIYMMFTRARISDIQSQFDQVMEQISDGLVKFFKELIQSDAEDFITFADYLKRGGHARIAAYLWNERNKNKDRYTAYEERKLQEFRRKLKRDVEKYVNESIYYDKSIVSCIQSYYFDGDATVREAFNLYAKDIAAIDVEAPFSLKLSELSSSELSYLIRSMIQVGDNALRLLSESGLDSLKSSMYSAWYKSDYAQIARDAYEFSSLAAGFVEFFDNAVKELIADHLAFNPPKNMM
jgi:hypothetical protein